MLRTRVWKGVWLLCLLVPGPAWSCTAGRVFADANGDGRYQPGEQGMPGVLVSDGQQVVSTGADGSWRGLSPAADGEVFLVKPAGQAIAAGAGGLPGFWRAAGLSGASCDFGLRPQPPATGPRKIIVSSDPQVGNLREAGFLARIFARSLARHGDAALGLTLGDIANDDLSLYPELIRITTSLGLPWLHLPGNHDLDAPADDRHSLASYRRSFGPDSYAWEEDEASFAMLDNVVVLEGERPGYVAGLREEQFDFLAQYLARADRDRLLVIAAHMPWFDTAAPGRPPTVRSADRERLFALLQAFPRVLLLTGHRHTQRRVLHGADSGWHGDTPLVEQNIGAMSGAFWSGVDDAEGIPVSTMADGSPRGFAVMLVDRDGGYRFDWHPTSPEATGGGHATPAMRLHAPRVLRRGAYPAWGVYANVFFGHEDSRVEYRVGEGEWTPMTRRLAPDPALLVENVRDDMADTLLGFDRSPEPEASPHLWRGTLPTALDAGRHRIEVRSIDAAGRESRASTHYRLEDAKPR